ncbi:ABC transporter substrate-binding protein [Formicincola oecophyllae]|uniref:ABC transporter substrate-binding protein n=1 Tax=Formicincola oecophyllae TaxID=2558361 RepID=A0A4Y6UDB6_9PROT|nr:ABC transporter substrate-binding protein [Formicincola oecophyllae]QDH14025.1 ABC transporter substrate-binding protein [Formicincola oecophyllae]
MRFFGNAARGAAIAVVASMAFQGTAHASQATDFVDHLGHEMVAVLNSSQSMDQKRRDFVPIVDHNVNIPAIARYCLGRYWRTATPAQREEYVRLFKAVMLNAVLVQMGQYTNISYTLLGSVPSPDGEKVTLQITRPGQDPVTMTVVVAGQPPKLVDIYGEGASMRLTQRTDYTSFLSRHGGNVQTLIDALQRKVNAGN